MTCGGFNVGEKGGEWVVVVVAVANMSGYVVVWVPDSSFSDVFFYLATNRGNLRCVASAFLFHLDSRFELAFRGPSTSDPHRPCLAASLSTP